jgi:hypothetical protein
MTLFSAHPREGGDPVEGAFWRLASLRKPDPERCVRGDWIPAFAGTIGFGGL